MQYVQKIEIMTRTVTAPLFKIPMPIFTSNSFVGEFKTGTLQRNEELLESALQDILVMVLFLKIEFSYFIRKNFFVILK